MIPTVDGLRADQTARLARHRERAFVALLAASTAYDGRRPLRDTPEGQALLNQPRDLQVSLALSAAAAAVERRRIRQADAETDRLIRVGAADVAARDVTAEWEKWVEALERDAESL
jgi:hypothetical protein